MSNTAETISSLRKKKGMTQEELADKLFVSRSLVSMWELGTRIPDYTNVVRLANLFHVNESDLISGEEYLYRFEEDQNAFFKEIDEITQLNAVSCDRKNADAVFRDFLIGLRKKDRDIFMSRYHQAKTSKAIAAEFNMSESAVKVRLTRIRKKLIIFVQRRSEHENE